MIDDTEEAVLTEQERREDEEDAQLRADVKAGLSAASVAREQRLATAR